MKNVYAKCLRITKQGLKAIALAGKDRPAKSEDDLANVLFAYTYPESPFFDETFTKEMDHLFCKSGQNKKESWDEWAIKNGFLEDPGFN
jgi:hypothetical protein